MREDVRRDLSKLVVGQNERVKVAQPLEVAFLDGLDAVLLHLELLQRFEDEERFLGDRRQMISSEIESLELPVKSVN